MLDYLLSLQIAICAFVFSAILLSKDHVFYGYAVWLKTLNSKLAMPLGLCELCLSGQLALWSFLIRAFLRKETVFIPELVFFISLTILLTFMLAKLKSDKTCKIKKRPLN